MARDYLQIAVRSLTKRRLRSYLTLIGVFIGIAAVVGLMSLGDGLRNAITGQFNLLGPDFLTIQAGGVQLGPPGTGVVTPLTTDIRDKINDVNGVEIAMGRLIKSVQAEFNDEADVRLVGSIPEGDARKEIERQLGLEAEQGRLLKDGDNNKIVLGANFAKDGDIFGKPVKVGNRILLNGKSFQVVGIAKAKGSFVIDSVIQVNEEAMRDLLDEPDELSAIIAKAATGQDMQVVKERIEKLLRKERNVDEGEEDFSVQLAANAIQSLDDTLFGVQLFVSIIALISLLVGGIGIMNTMYTSVLERTKEIGIMKSIGAKNSDIFMLFFIESGLLGMVGGIIGVLVGAFGSIGLAAIASAQLGSDLIQAQVSPYLVIGALLFSFIVGCIAGIVPAVQASKLHPVEALRFAK